MPLDKDGDALKKLHARMVDTLNGYEEGIEKAENAEVTAFLERFRTLRAQHAGELDTVLRSAGLEPQRDGSWMTYVHEGIMKVRSAIGTLDESVKDDVVRGEQAILDLYDEALDAARGEPSAHVVLARQAAELRTEIERTNKA